MTRKEALTELLAKVEAGWPPDIDTPYMRPYIAAFGANWIAGHANSANRGSLDAAKALHEAVLSERAWAEVSFSARYAEESKAEVTLDRGTWQATACTPARAWLIAILKALIAECDE